MTTDTVSSFADLDQLDLAAKIEYFNNPEPTVGDEPVVLEPRETCGFSGESLSIQMRSGIAANQFLVTSMLRGIAGNLQFARVSAEDKLDDMQAKAQARMQAGENELDHPEHTGLTDAQQIFAESLLEQLTFIEDLFVDIRAFWKEANDNPEFKLLNRTDIEVRQACEQPLSARPPKRTQSAEPTRSTPSATSLHAAQPSLHAGSN